MVTWLADLSLKLQYLMRYCNEAVHAGERVIVFVEWPVVQLAIEGALAMLGFNVRSIRSAQGTATRNNTVNDFNKPHKRIDVLVAS